MSFLSSIFTGKSSKQQQAKKLQQQAKKRQQERIQGVKLNNQLIELIDPHLKFLVDIKSNCPYTGFNPYISFDPYKSIRCNYADSIGKRIDNYHPKGLITAVYKIPLQQKKKVISDVKQLIKGMEQQYLAQYNKPQQQKIKKAQQQQQIRRAMIRKTDQIHQKYRDPVRK